jgi:4-hydroxybenzoate polyprenyltransferase
MLLMVLYSLLLKHKMILDAIVISIGFVLRAVAGAVVIGVFISPWLVICTFTLCLFLAFGKRRSEIALLTNDGPLFRKTLGGYNVELLNHMLDVTSAIAIVSFLLYSMDSRTLTVLKTNDLVYTMPLVLYCIFRFSVLIQKGTYSGPVQIILRDIPFQLGLFLWAIACTAIVYAAKLGVSMTDILAY